VYVNNIHRMVPSWLTYLVVVILCINHGNTRATESKQSDPELDGGAAMVEEDKRMGELVPVIRNVWDDGMMPYKRMIDGLVPYKRYMADGAMPYKRMYDGFMPYRKRFYADGAMPYKRDEDKRFYHDGSMPYKRSDKALSDEEKSELLERLESLRDMQV